MNKTRRAAARRVQLVKKSLAEFRVRRRESIIICFLPRHVRGRKHFARSERRIVRCQRTTEAQNAAKLSRKSGEATFSTVSKGAAFRSASVCQKGLAEFRVRRRESSMSCFLSRHVRGGKHFARSERRIVRCQRTTEAQNAANLSRKSGFATFSTVYKPHR